jgi:hypothetical protein
MLPYMGLEGLLKKIEVSSVGHQYENESQFPSAPFGVINRRLFGQ